MESPNYDYVFKLLIIGDSGVGKSCLLMRYVENEFSEFHLATIGIDFKVKMIELDDQKIKLQIWDSAGQERFKTITKTYFRGAMGIVLAYDCTSRESFANVTNWAAQFEHCTNPHTVKVLISNKNDCENKEVSKEEGLKLARDMEIGFFETSAKTGENVEEVFEHLAREIRDKEVYKHINESGINLDTSFASQKKKCC